MMPRTTMQVTVVFDQKLPNVPGKSMRGVLVEYGPGGSSPGHTHPKSAFIYATVLEGAIRSQVNNGPVKTYRAGESFAENPGDRHGVSENASKTARARLLAVFVVDTRRHRSDDRHQQMDATRKLAGAMVPSSPLVDRAMEYAPPHTCEPYLFNHVVRSWLLASRLGERQNIAHDAEVVAVGTLLHDITLNENFAGPRRFEVEAADLCAQFRAR